MDSAGLTTEREKSLGTSSFNVAAILSECDTLLLMKRSRG